MDIKIIQDFIKDKKVLLIGNGSCDDSISADYNIVIRMNAGITRGRADIWVNGLIQYHSRGWSWDKLDFKYMLRLNAENKGSRLRRGYPERYKDITYFWEPEEYLKYSKKVGYTQPFTGTTALHWLSEYTQPSSITIIGMDFFKNGCPVPSHKPDMDRAYVESLIRDKNIIRL